MDTLSKARELLSGIDAQIADLLRDLRALRSHRREISKVVNRLAGGRRPGRPRGKRPRGRVGRPKGAKRAPKRKAAKRRAARTAVRGKRRTNWERVIARQRATFTLDDLVRASRKKKPTVSQAVLKLKRAKKIAPTGKRGVYKKV